MDYILKADSVSRDEENLLQILEDQNHTGYILWPQCNNTNRNETLRNLKILGPEESKLY